MFKWTKRKVSKPRNCPNMSTKELGIHVYCPCFQGKNEAYRAQTRRDARRPVQWQEEEARGQPVSSVHGLRRQGRYQGGKVRRLPGPRNEGDDQTDRARHGSTDAGALSKMRYQGRGRRPRLDVQILQGSGHYQGQEDSGGQLDFELHIRIR